MIEQGVMLPDTMRILSIVVGIAASLLLVGLPLGLLCFGLAIHRVGTEIDTANGWIRDYGSVLGLRWGEWIAVSPFKAIAILAKRRVGTLYSRGQMALGQAEINHDVTLVDGTHRKRFLLKAGDTIEDARALAVQVSDTTGLPIERYAPQQIGVRRR